MLPVEDAPLVATVLPPGEGFGPGRSGAIGLLVHRFARVLPGLVIGGPQAGPVFPDVAFRPAVPRRWMPGSVNARYAATVAAILREMKPALIEVHNRPEVALALLRRFPRIPVVLVLQNDPQSMRGAKSVGQRRALLGRLAAVVTVSAFLARRLTEGMADPPRQPVTILNSIDFSLLPPQQERDSVILFSGRVVPEKGVDSFVAACARALPQLPGWHAEIIGADRFRTDAPDTAFVRAVRSAALATGVRMLGYRDHPDVLAALTRAAIAVVPSRWEEPFGLAALEAMACGAALVCSARGGLPEVAGDAALYIDPEDPAGFADALVALANDPPRRMALAEAGRVRSRRFGLPGAAHQLAALRAGLIGAGGPAPPGTLYPGDQAVRQETREQG